MKKPPKEFARIASTPVKHPAYWKLKAAFFELQAAEGQARDLMARASAKFAQVMTDAGLDPKALYALKDDDESVTLSTKP